MTPMTTIRTMATWLVEGLKRLQSAGAISAAVEARRVPRTRDLQRLGIDPRAFTSIGHG
jgi:hypothetical protein